MQIKNELVKNSPFHILLNFYVSDLHCFTEKNSLMLIRHIIIRNYLDFSIVSYTQRYVIMG